MMVAALLKAKGPAHEHPASTVAQRNKKYHHLDERIYCKWKKKPELKFGEFPAKGNVFMS